LAYRAGAELVDMEFDTFMMSPEQLKMLFGGNPDEDEILSATGGAHYSCGGIRVDVNRRSTVPGLYAAGEVAGGTFGSVRPRWGTGRRAAEAAGEVLPPDEAQVRTEEEKLEGILRREGTPPRHLIRKLRRTMWEKVGPIRREETLREALEEVRELKGKFEEVGARNLRELGEAVELGFMLDVAEVIATAALERRESRSAHWRLDYLRPDNDRWLKNLVISLGPDGGPRVQAVPVRITRISSPGPCRIGTRWTWGYVSPEEGTL